MKTKKRIYQALVFSMIALVSSCAKKSSVPVPPLPAVTTPPTKEQPVVDETAATKAGEGYMVGTFVSVTCFLDRSQTIAWRANVYAKATYTFNSDLTAVSRHVYYTDKKCATTADVKPEITRFTKFSTDQKVDDVSILVLQKERGVVRNPRLYIPVVRTENGFRLSIDYLQSISSGPFFTMPDHENLQEFEEKPNQGTVEFKRVAQAPTAPANS